MKFQEFIRQKFEDKYLNRKITNWSGNELKVNKIWAGETVYGKFEVVFMQDQTFTFVMGDDDDLPEIV